MRNVREMWGGGWGAEIRLSKYGLLLMLGDGIHGYVYSTLCMLEVSHERKKVHFILFYSILFCPALQLVGS